MGPIRRNYYNQEIYMIHKEKLIPLVRKTDNPLLKEYINMLIKRYEKEKDYLDDIPYELRSWPNCYIGLSINDKNNKAIIDLAMQDSLDDYVSIMDFGYYVYACGIAFLEDKYDLLEELDKIKELFGHSATIRDIIEVISEDTLNYLLAYTQTYGCVTIDARIVFYNGERFEILDVIPPDPYEVEYNKMYANALVNTRRLQD